MNFLSPRIRISPQKDKEGNIGLRFQHPAPVEVGEAGNIGWREEDNLRAQAIAAVAVSGSSAVSSSADLASGPAPSTPMRVRTGPWS